jgi:hypothetical protein
VDAAALDDRIIGRQFRFVDLKRPAQQGLGLFRPIEVLEQPDQRLQIQGHGKRVGFRSLLVGGERSPHQRFRLGGPVQRLEHEHHELEARGDHRIISRIGLLGER